MQSQTPTRIKLATAALAIGALWFVLCRHLSGEWSASEQYSYGWLVPLFAAFLFWLRWEDRPAGLRPAEAPSSKLQAPTSRRGKGAVALGVLALLLLFPVRLFEVANPDWRPLGWVHTAVVVVLMFLLIWCAGGAAWVRHFTFPIAFFFVAVPWVSPIEQPIVQGLMRIVAAVATEAVGLCGIPAQLEGNLIRVSSGLVGVNEACSGVRSLQTSLMIGLLFGELKRLSVPRRIALVLGAIALAIVANFGRAFLLVWVAATRDVAAVASWHDIAGYAIVAVVFVGSLGLAAWLGKGRGQKFAAANPSIGGSEVGAQESPTSDLRLPTSVFILSLLWLLAVEAGVEIWYRAHERNLAVIGRWTVRPPEKAPGFREIKIDELVQQTLRFDEGREVMWKSSPPEGAVTHYLFFFRWNPGSSSVLRARAHRPDICLPYVGWTLIADLGAKNYPGPTGLSIAARHVTFRQTQGNAVAHTFFCLQEDKIHREEARPDLLLGGGVQPSWSFDARTRVVRDGVRNLGQQVLETILISAPPMNDATAEERFAQMVRELVVVK